MILRNLRIGLCAALAACAAAALQPGKSTEADVKAAMGPPTETRVLADGARVLWYSLPIPNTAFGTERYAATIAPDGKLRSLEQRLKPEFIARVVPNKSRADDVRDLIGPPNRSYHLAGKPGEVWEYELQDFHPTTLYVQIAPDQVVSEVYTIEQSASPSPSGAQRR
jgi:hypothetical protein